MIVRLANEDKPTTRCWPPHTHIPSFSFWPHPLTWVPQLANAHWPHTAWAFLYDNGCGSWHHTLSGKQKMEGASINHSHKHYAEFHSCPKFNETVMVVKWMLSLCYFILTQSSTFLQMWITFGLKNKNLNKILIGSSLLSGFIAIYTIGLKALPIPL